MAPVSDSDDDRPLVKAGPSSARAQATKKPNGNGNSKAKKVVESDSDVSMSDGDDAPLSQATRSEPATPKARPQKRKGANGRPTVADSSSVEDDEDDDVPLALTPAKSAAVPMPGAIKATTTATTNGHAKQKVTSKPFINDADATNGSSSKTKAGGKANAKRVKAESTDEDDDDDDVPISKKAPARKKRKVKQESDGEDVSSDDDAPLVKPKKKTAIAKKGKTKANVKEESDEEDVKPAKGKKAAAVKKETDDKKAKKDKDKAKKEEEEEAEVFRWWEANAQGDGTDKWQKLEHNGVLFPPLYVPLPSNVKMKYDGVNVDLPPESEEVAGFYAALMETDHAKDATFNKNFFDDWRKVLVKYPPKNNVKITDLSLCDFRPMYEHFEAERARKKAMTTAEKKEAKAAKDELEGPFAACVLDGRKEKVGNFRVEPPSLFRGRGEHPRKGSLKLRVYPEDITINIAEGVPIPKPNVPGNWKKVIHDKTVTWLATWTENVNGNNKYVFLAAGSSLKGQSDMAKFEKARELKSHVDRIRQDYSADLKNKVMADRQRATAMYFIDKLALRAGNEKGDDEADTVGCCSLRCEHVTLEQPNYIIFDFLGKDSIRYYKRVPVDDQVFKNIKIFKQNKEDGDNLFDRVNTTTLNKHLTSHMKGLTAKVFRTYNASITFQQQLDENTPKKASLQERLNAYNKANRMVAILCNHQRTVPKTHDASMAKMKDKIRGLKYEKMKMRHVLCTLEPKYKKKAKYSEMESDIDDDWVAEHEADLEVKEIEKAQKKFEKENEKLVADGKAAQEQSELNERVKAIKDEFKRLKKEQGTGKATLKRERPVEKVEEAIEKLEERIATAGLQMVDRDEGKEVALGTSKINYLDPRITSAWCKDNDVPIEKLFSKTLLIKFPWALEVDADWKF